MTFRMNRSTKIDNQVVHFCWQVWDLIVYAILAAAVIFEILLIWYSIELNLYKLYVFFIDPCVLILLVYLYMMTLFK